MISLSSLRSAFLSTALALVAAVAATGCASIQVGEPTRSPSSAQAECGRTPGTAGIWRPQQNYCEY
jgi:hypothetical protein